DLLLVAVDPLGLREGALVPVELEPAQRVVDLVDVLRSRALAVRVLDTQHERAARMPRDEPVVQCRPRSADVQRAGRRGGEPDSHGHTPMLVGGHVSTSGGLVKAYERGIEFGCEALQIFNQSPRMWRPTQWKPDDIEQFRERMADGPIKSVVIHAVYLINAAAKDKEERKKSPASLDHA